MAYPVQTPQPILPTPPPAMMPTPMVLAYAGFWWRVLAWFIDSCVIGAAEYVIGLVTGLSQLGLGTVEDHDVRQISDIADTVQFGAPVLGHWHWHGGGLSVVGLVLTIAYFVALESSRWQATLGKRVCRLRVTDEAGLRIGILRALGRYLGKFVSAFILGIGFLMVGWTRRKQGLHDIMADTLVMRLRPADTVFGFQPPQAPPG